MGTKGGARVGESIGASIFEGVAVGREPCASFNLASTVASTLRVGSTGAGAALEQATKAMPMIIIDNTADFIFPLPAHFALRFLADFISMRISVMCL